MKVKRSRVLGDRRAKPVATNSAEEAGCTFLSAKFSFPSSSTLTFTLNFTRFFSSRQLLSFLPGDMAAVPSGSGMKRKAPLETEDEVKTNKRLKAGISQYFLPIKRDTEKDSGNPSFPLEQALLDTPNDTADVIPLEALLDFDELVSEDEICQRFEAIAQALFFRYRIRITNPESKNTTHHLELLEIEFYIIKPGHADPYCHASAEQDVAGRWYVS